MPRVIQITAPAARADALLEGIRTLEGVISLTHQPGVSLQPPGDVITVEVPNRRKDALMRCLEAHGLGNLPEISVTMSEASAVISLPHQRAILRDSSESTWEEMEQMIAKESNMTINSLFVMATAGMLTVAGIASNSLHLVIGAMVIAPGFEPFSRIALGVVCQNGAWLRGFVDCAKGYAALILGAALATWLGELIGKNPYGAESSYFPPGTLLHYWNTLTLWSIVSSLIASVAGALLIASNRSVLTGGVMIALSLVPAAALIGMGIAGADWNLAAAGLRRWAIEVALVLGASLIVFGWLRLRARRASAQ